MRDVTASVAVQGNKMTLSSLDASALDGTVRASGTMAIQDGAPHWTLDIRAAAAKASAVAEIFGEQWGSGTASGEARLTMSGYRTEDLASSATGDFSFIWQNGSLLAPASAGNSPLDHFDRWTARGAIANGALTLTGGGISSGVRTNALRGSIGFDRSLNLTLETRRGRVKITGTPAQPVIQ